VYTPADMSEIGRVVDLRIDGLGHFSLSGTRAKPMPQSEPAYLEEAVA
jgi:hypothetical protein